MNANQIKLILLDYLIQHNPSFIVSELPFYKGFRKADIVAFAKNKAQAYEIKSDRDDLRGLEDQMHDYSQVFPSSYLVTTAKHIKNVRKTLPKHIGIIIIESDKLHLLRRAAERNRLSKCGILQSIPTAYLGPKKTIHPFFQTQIRDEANISGITLDALKITYYQTMERKYARRYNNFLADRGEITTLSDLYYLEAQFT